MEKIISLHSDLILLAKGAAGYRLPTSEEIETTSEDTFTFPGYKAFYGNGLSGCGDSVKSRLAAGEALCEVGLREAWNLLPAEDYAAAGKGAELLNWSRGMRCCPADGAVLKRASEISKRCPECGKEYFPSLWPAIVVLVLKGDEALLVHARTLKRPGVQTLVAGFVETGESLEECVVREIREETSLEVEDVRYRGSQSWPFPHQLMVGFTARYRSGTLRFADGELTAGGFFRRENLPELPTMPSLSRMIINDWIAGKFG